MSKYGIALFLVCETKDEILLFSVVQTPHFSLKPCGGIAGSQISNFIAVHDTNNRPYGLRFWPACRTGATLASVWLDGNIKIHSLVYKTKLFDEY